MAREHNRFPYRLVVLGFPLVGGLYLGVVFGWAFVDGRPPDALAAPVEFFAERVFETLWDSCPSLLGSVALAVFSFVVLWEVVWLVVGVGVALLAWLVNILIPRGREER